MNNADFEIKENVLIKYHGISPFVAIPDGIQRIGKGAFRDCRELREITIPESVQEIEEEAFLLCVNLAMIHGAANVTSIGRDAFARTPWYRYYS